MFEHYSDFVHPTPPRATTAVDLGGEHAYIQTYINIASIRYTVEA